MSSARRGRGKDIDRTSSWSEPVWDKRGFWIYSRYGPDGQTIEYNYEVPDSTQDPTTPRNPALPNDQDNYLESLYEPSISLPSSSEAGQPEGTQTSNYYSNQKQSTSPATPRWSTVELGTEGAWEGHSGHAQASEPNTFADSAEYTSSSKLPIGLGPSHQSVGGGHPQSSFSQLVSAQGYVSSNYEVHSRHGSSGGYYVPSDLTSFSDSAGSGNILAGTDQISIDRPSSALSLGPIQEFSRPAERPAKAVPKLGDRYQRIKQPSRFFKRGRVFKALWTEPAGDVTDAQDWFVIPSRFGEKAFAKIRHFVVVREMQGCCLCLMLNTYNRQGASKEGVRAENYAAVFPLGGKSQVSEEERLTKEAFPIKVEEAEESIDPTSRINFGRVYTVEHNIKVLKVGRIPNEHLQRLEDYFVNSIVGPQALTMR